MIANVKAVWLVRASQTSFNQSGEFSMNATKAVSKPKSAATFSMFAAINTSPTKPRTVQSRFQ